MVYCWNMSFLSRQNGWIVLLTGRDNLLNDQAAIIELKQWEKCEEGDAERIVTFVGGNNRDVLHPPGSS